MDTTADEVVHIARRNDQAVQLRGSSDHRVFQRHRETTSPHFVTKLRPHDCRAARPVETHETRWRLVKPRHQVLLPPTIRQSHDAFPHLTEHDRVHDDVRMMRQEPLQDLRLSLTFRWFRQNVHVGKILHSAKVAGGSRDVISPRSGCTNQSFSGQASNHSTQLRGAGSENRSRYSPWPKRSMSQGWPGCNESASRYSSGNSSKPLAVSVAVMSATLRSCPWIVKTAGPPRPRPPSRTRRVARDKLGC